MNRIWRGRLFHWMQVSLLLTVVPGCGESGPTRYAVSGSAHYAGQPIPAGEISFEPDRERGNEGPGGYAVIRQGRYETAPNCGVIGGAHLVRIRGYAGGETDAEVKGMTTNGPALFEEFTQPIDLPHAASELDLIVPETPIRPTNPSR